jgi:ribosomal protein S27E
METKTSVIISFIILVVLIFGLYLFSDWFSKVTGYSIGESEQESLARCLAEKGAQYYYSDNCADCAKQQEVFGSAFKFLTAVNCSSLDCKNIKQLPAWYVNGSVKYGFLELSELKNLSGC